MKYPATSYASVSFSELKRRSQILAAGIESITPLLPAVDDSSVYQHDYTPRIRWTLLPRDRRYNSDIDINGENTVTALAQVTEIFPNLGFSCHRWDDSSDPFFWLREAGRPTVASIEARLPSIYLLAKVLECHLEGWTYIDEEAWRHGLSAFIKASGFDSETIGPGQS